MCSRKTLLIVGTALVLLGIAGLVRISRPAAENAGRWDLRAEEGAGTGDSTAPWAVASGLLLSAGAALLGIGVGRWRRPRVPSSEADFTGSGTLQDREAPPPAA